MTHSNSPERMPTILELENIDETLGPEEMTREQLLQKIHELVREEMRSDELLYELYTQKEGLQLECERLRLKCDKLWDKSQGLTTLLHRARIKLELLFSLHAAYASACMWCNCYIIYSFFHIASLWLL